MATAEEILGQARLMVRAKVPYFRAMLLSLVPRPVEGIGTIGVTERALLVYDPEFVARQTPAQAAGLLVHEILHLLHRHMARVSTRDPFIWNLAGDLAINPSVRDMGFELPGGKDAGMFPKELGWPEGETADQYYQRLLQEQDKAEKAREKQGAGRGQCGSCAGHALPGEPQGGKAPRSPQGAPGGEGQGEGPGDDDGRSQAQLERAARQVAAAVKEHAKGRGRGSMPAGMERWAEGMLEPPKVPWQAKLARVLRAGVAYRAGAVVHRYDGPSRRQAGLGYGSGVPMLPRLRAPVPRVAVVADTSGSMSERDLGIALREAGGVLKAVNSEVVFLTCDAAIHGVQQVVSVEQMAKNLKGGGGTDFVPAFDAIAKLRPRPSVVIFCTDGDGSCPSAPPPGMHVIWLLTGKRVCTPCTWGEQIRMEE